MPRKLKHHFVAEQFKKSGCELLDHYVNAGTLLHYKCKCGTDSQITWNRFQRGQRCRACGGNQKPTINYLIVFYRQQNCRLLEIEYKNSTTKMKFRCCCGGIEMLSWASFRHGHRCRICAGQYTYEVVRDFFEKAHCQLRETQYHHCQKTMDYICSCGMKSKISLDNFLKGKRCKQCAIQRNSGSGHYKWKNNREDHVLYIKLRKRCYEMLSRCLVVCKNVSKQDRTHQQLGYTPIELLKHLETFSNWENIKQKDWHLDHVFPISAFGDHNISDLQIINSLDNLQPLLKKDNLSKSNRYDKVKFESWLAEKIKATLLKPDRRLVR